MVLKFDRRWGQYPRYEKLIVVLQTTGLMRPNSSLYCWSSTSPHMPSIVDEGRRVVNNSTFSSLFGQEYLSNIGYLGYSLCFLI